MKKLTFLPTLLLPVLIQLSACTTSTPPAADKHNDEETVMSVLYQQRAAEYRALCLQAYNLARKRVDQALANKRYHGKKFAVITDLDETALDNSASSAWVYFHDTTSTFPLLQQWWLKGIADSVPGSVAFFKYANSKGIDIYYVSNRANSDTVVKAAMRNMNSLGFPLTSAGDRGHYLFLDSTAPNSSKEGRRRQIESTDSVIAFLGDNLADLDAAFDGQPREQRQQAVDQLTASFGDRYIVFPNAIYGDWENVLYRNFHGNPTLVQKDSMRVLMLDTTEVISLH